MISVYLQCERSQVDALVAELHERGTLGVLELHRGLRAWFDDGADLEFIAAHGGEVSVEEEEDWVRRTRDSFPPLEVGDRFWLAPPWNPGEPPDGRMRLEMNPGMACGTGWHPCTRMCIEAMERHLRPGDRVLDVGVGSGILSVAALLLGAGSVFGCDTDVDVIAIAHERIGGGVFAGSAQAIADAACDMVAANISGPVVESLWPDLRRACRSGGVMILSGFQADPDLTGVLERMERDGWRCVVCRRD